MLKVRFETIALRVPVIDNSGEHDAKMDEQKFSAIQHALATLGLGQDQEPLGQLIAGAAASPAHQNGWRPDRKQGITDHLENGQPLFSAYAQQQAPVSQVDPPIDTTVRDSEMRGSEREMTLDELRERPEKTRAPPRPRANSWRHGNG